MEKYFLSFAIVVVFLSTVVITSVGQDFIRKNPDQEICVQSRSCAINYMNKLEKNDENLKKE